MKVIARYVLKVAKACLGATNIIIFSTKRWGVLRGEKKLSPPLSAKRGYRRAHYREVFTASSCKALSHLPFPKLENRNSFKHKGFWLNLLFALYLNT